MKNTEYKDMFDFGAEALSMDHTFSTTQFPSLKNTFTIGEHIRGMNHVSPLATVKFFNQSSDDLLTKYYPDAGSPVEGTFTYVSDVGSNLEPVIQNTVKDFYYYGVQDVNNFAFRVIIFSSTDATKLKESFEVSLPKGREILMFVEDNSADKISGTYGAIKISNDVLSFLNKSGRLEYDLYNNDEIYKEIKKVIPELKDNQIKSLLQQGYIEDIRVDIVKTYFKLASFFSSGVSLISPGLGILTNDALRLATSILLEKLILQIEKTKFDENRWQPKPPKLENGETDQNYTYDPLISSGKDSNGTVNFTEIIGLLKTMLTEQNNLVRSILNIKKDFRKSTQPKGFPEILYNLYLSAYDTIYDVITNLEDISNLDIIKYSIQTYNALLCGVWNGLVDAVSGIFAMIKMIYDGITMGKDFAQNIDQYLPVLLEQFDEAVQAIKEISFSETAKYIDEKLKKINLTFDPVACSYFTGYAFGFIISLIIEIIVGILISGGILDIPIIIQKLEEAIFGIFRIGWGVVKGAARKIRTFSKFVVKSIKDLIKGFEELIKFLKGERGSFKKIIDDVFEASSIKKIGQYGGKVLSESEVEDWAKLVMKKYGTKLLKVDKFDDPELLASFDPNTNTIKYTDDVTEYLMIHEHYHAEEMHKIGFNKYVKDAPLIGVKEADYTIKNWQHIYKREKYVYDRLVKNAKIHKLNEQEVSTPPFGHAFQYLDFIILKLEKRNIPIPKI
ncbi:zincin-like metallopeptidase toxin domain-containing protein [uncultured Chryseobacterium sp.]|uniref:zincin-like metallopeptidase toxin domain-containing protein n=1 Tax=uncultured Chryseobacterium sp. TaxID=259322 RepID=UPI0025EB85CD|nr:zincin-like metallopeptidase toxin domain-containing protein [uncultured Chryseobacterium sp.]